MAWVIRKIQLEAWATEALIRQLQTQTNVAVARHYGVVHATVATWRARFNIPAFTQGAGKRSAIQEALLHYMQPGQEYSFRELRGQIPGSRQQVYWMLMRLTQDGHLCRSGRRNHYRWQCLPQAEEPTR